MPCSLKPYSTRFRVFQQLKEEPEQPEPEPHLSLLRCRHTENTLCSEELSQPKTGTARTAPKPVTEPRATLQKGRNQTEGNRFLQEYFGEKLKGSLLKGSLLKVRSKSAAKRARILPFRFSPLAHPERSFWKLLKQCLFCDLFAVFTELLAEWVVLAVFRKLQKPVAVYGGFQEFQEALDQRISGSGKGKPARKFWSTQLCPHLLRELLVKDTITPFLLEFFWKYLIVIDWPCRSSKITK